MTNALAPRAAAAAAPSDECFEGVGEGVNGEVGAVVGKSVQFMDFTPSGPIQAAMKMVLMVPCTA